MFNIVQNLFSFLYLLAQFHQALQIMDRSTTGGTYTQPGARESMAFLQNMEIQQGGSPSADRWAQGVRKWMGLFVYSVSQ